jgi:quercetin dioxygenase-like cupin family protein
MPARVITIAELPIDRPMDLIERQRIVGEHMMVSRVVLHRGFRIERHQHANEQMSIVLSGRIRFLLGEVGTADESSVELVSGQVIVLPPHVPHGAEAIEETVVLDLFSPPSTHTGVDRA